MADRYRYNSSEWDILEAMNTFGGSFVQGLARLYRLADADNRKALEATFRKYFVKYDELAYRHSQNVVAKAEQA